VNLRADFLQLESPFVLALAIDPRIALTGVQEKSAAQLNSVGPVQAFSFMFTPPTLEGLFENKVLKAK